MEGYLIATATIGGIYVLLTLGLSLQYGFTGLINFGHVGFYAIGAYASALVTLAGYPIAAGMLAAVLLAGVSAVPLGLFAIRLREDYLAIVTLAFSEIVRIVLIGEQWLTGGNVGLSGIPHPFAATLAGGTERLYLGLVLAADLLGVLVVLRVVHSPFGRLIRAIRDDEVAVRALGKDPVGYKMAVLVIGAALAGLAGSLYAHYVTYISPDQFTPIVTFYVWIAMILGGAGRISGAVVGSMLLLGFLEGTRFLRDMIPAVPEVEMASLRLFAVGLGLVVFIIFLPQGLMPRLSRPRLSRR
jgi:branched-chain amino acid transport system permease protein